MQQQADPVHKHSLGAAPPHPIGVRRAVAPSPAAARSLRSSHSLVEANLGLAHAAAARFAGRGESSEDLLQVAMIGLLRAANRFDPDRGVSFST